MTVPRTSCVQEYIVHKPYKEQFMKEFANAERSHRFVRTAVRLLAVIRLLRQIVARSGRVNNDYIVTFDQ